MRNKQEKNSLVAQYGGFVPAQNREAEKAILGAMMLESHTIEKVMPILTIDDFYVDAHQRIYNAMVKIHVNGQGIDTITVIDQLNKSAELEMVGGAYFVMGLTIGIVQTADFLSWCFIVREKSIKRTIGKLASELYANSFENEIDPLELLSKAEIGVSKILNSFSSQKVKTIGDVAIGVLQEMEKASLEKPDFLGIPCGIDSIDKVTLGFCAPDLIILAAGPGEGKSTMMLQWALHMGINNNPVGLFSLEMKDRQLMWKVFSSLIDEEVKTIRKGGLSEEKFKLLHSVINDRLFNAKVFLQDKPGITITELCSIIRSLVAKHGLKGAFIDYIQLIKGPLGKKFGTREEEVNYISKELKALNMELNIFIVALSQLSRMEKGTKRMYRPSDLRESGAIEQDADGIMFIWRPAYHDVQRLQPNDAPFAFNDVIFDIAKWRLGDVGQKPLVFNGPFSRFEEKEDTFKMTPLPQLNFPDPNARIETQYQKPFDSPEDLPF